MLFEFEEKTQYFNFINNVIYHIEATNKEEAIEKENERIKNINNKYNGNIKILSFEIVEA